MAGAGRSETAHWVGTSLVAFGFLLPIVGFFIYSLTCLEPCGQGGPGTCMFNRVTCDLNPVVGWFAASILAFTFIGIGLHLRTAGEREWLHCRVCGEWLRSGERGDHPHSP